MPRSSQRRKTSKNRPPAELKLNPLRTGMPALDSIISVRNLATPEAAAVAATLDIPTYRIIRTNEVDAYERAATSQETLNEAMAEAAPVGDNFKGKSRKATKLSIADAPMESFQDLKNLINSLTPDDEMADHDPPIKTTSTSRRVKEEKRNVRVKAFIYAASRENDNDFHLIIGRATDKVPEMYMTMELSGLPSSSSASFSKLKSARDAYKAFFDTDLPGLTYDFYDPPIAIRVEGSLFFDMTHAKGQHPGPKSLKSRMPTIWEVHPITKIAFNP